ncbi:unnamed protein product [Orchesella dallaii]|uniref:Uncharacterized protein n=1 Tax=Orchesella dallaii TaxID=48710 RepID=A0ABP1QLG2_9HEXA
MDSYSPQQYFYRLENMLLNSSQVLRKLFQLHWKTTTGKPWEETEKQGKEFVDGMGQPIYKDATKKEKRFISKGLLSEWNMNTLSTALELFRNAEHEDDKTKAEYSAVLSLKRLSNELSRHPTKKFFKKEFNRRLDTFRASLRALQVKEERIDIMVKKAGATSSQTALESLKKLVEEGERELKSNEFATALEHFQMATNIPSLLLVYQGIAFEKRAECYVILLTNQNKQYVNQTEAEKYKAPAFSDAKQALECNDESWKAHHLLAQLYATYIKLDEALEHCEAALILAPEQSKLNTYLDYLKTLKDWMNLVGKYDFRIPFLPVPLSDFAIQSKAEKGVIIKLTEEQMTVVQTSGVYKGQEDVMQGNAYARGLTVSRNYEEAVRLFIKATKVKNAAGIYNLAFCYGFGLGVKLNREKAHELYLEAANLPGSISVPASDFCVENFGVADSQFAVASFYLDEMIREPDCSEVFKWLKKSAENGNEKATYTLGVMHIVGNGIPRNYRIGETYLKQAIDLGNYEAAQELFKFYDSYGEPDKARVIRELLKNHDFIKVTKSDEIKFIERYKTGISLKKKCEPYILEFEAKNKVDGSNMLFTVRYQLAESGGISVERIFKFLKEAQSIGSSYNLWLDGSFKWDDMLYEKFVTLLYEGSPAATLAMDSLQSNYELWRAIIQIPTKNIKMEDCSRLIKFLFKDFLRHVLYATYIYLPPDGVTKLKSVTAQLFEMKCVGNNGKKCEEDKRIRFCYAYVQILFGIQGESKGDISVMVMDILKEAIEMYPNSNPCYNLLLYLHLRDENHEAGLYYAEKELENFPEDKQLQFARAKHFSMLPNSDREQIVDNYKVLLRVTPPDYWQMPDAYYSIANVYRLSFAAGENNNKRVLSLMKQYYKMGQWSESNMLPCYLPYRSKNKVLVEHAIETTEVS